MSIETFQHRRTTGKQLTYEVAISSNRYSISLDGRQLKEWGRPIVAGGDVPDPLQATRIFAISDIENLTGMSED